VETTPCHLSSFLLFPTTPVACPTHCFLIDWVTFPGSQLLVSLSLLIHVIHPFLTFFYDLSTLPDEGTTCPQNNRFSSCTDTLAHPRRTECLALPLQKSENLLINS